jgi:hypothetical protein
MLTLFSVPKPFRQAHVQTIQRNAIRSWKLLDPACEIILFGYEEGIAEVAAELQVCHVSDVERNEYGTPLLNSIFDQARHMARNSILGYINSDIILMSDFLPAVERVASQRATFLLIGRRWDIDIAARLDFGSGWEARMRANIRKHATLYTEHGIDCFVFPKDMPVNMPPFAVGRPAWDNWFLCQAQQLAYPIIDATRAVTFVHQKHDYQHVPQRTDDRWAGPEATLNKAMAGTNAETYSTYDADEILTHNFLLPALGYKYLRRSIRHYLMVRHPRVYLLLKRLRDSRKQV